MLAHSPSVDDGAAATMKAKSPRARKRSLYCIADEVPRARGLKNQYYAPRNFREWNCDLGKKVGFSLPIYRLSQRIKASAEKFGSVRSSEFPAGSSSSTWPDEPICTLLDICDLDVGLSQPRSFQSDYRGSRKLSPESSQRVQRN